MQTVGASGFKVSGADKKALEHYLATTPKVWLENALKGMINKAIKTIKRDWFEKYKATQTGSVPTKDEDIIPCILAMEGFKPYRASTPEIPIVQRKETPDIEVWTGGFQIMDYEKAALEAYYNDFESMMVYFMENKVDCRKKAFVKEIESVLSKDPLVTEMPSKHDDLINLMVAKAGYKNRATIDTEEAARIASQQG
jgi:hypothetical protein